MEQLTSDQARQVWQRVRGEEGKTSADLRGLIMGEWNDAATYLQLSRRFSGREAATLQQLFREEQTHVACLKGIYTLITGQKPEIKSPAPVKEPVEIALRKCYGREMRSLSEYEARQNDQEYGPVFRRLAEQEREHCRIVLELIGGLQKK